MTLDWIQEVFLGVIELILAFKGFVQLHAVFHLTDPDAFLDMKSELVQSPSC